MPLRRTCLAVLAIVQTAFLLLLLAGHEPWSGPVVLSLTADHGVHVGDIPVLALWAVGMVAVVSMELSDRA